jgi:hypothetical protein
MNSERVLRYGSPEQKLQMLQTLAQDYQIPLPNGTPAPVAQPAAQAEGEHWDPTVVSLKQQLGQLQQQLNSRAVQEQEAERQRVISDIVAFQNATTEAGQPANPYFAEVADEIAFLAQAERLAGRKPDLAKLYKKACKTNEAVYAKVQADELKVAEQKRQAEAKQRALQARTAGASVSGAPVGGSSSGMPAKSLREEILRARNTVAGRV